MIDDKNYWKKFYNSNETIKECSDFCVFIMDYFKTNEDIINILDCGCGNGRDSYELSKKYNVIGIDSSGFVPSNRENLVFLCDDFVKVDKSNYDLIYSRFTFHSITNEQHQLFLNTIKQNSYLAIEARSIKGLHDDVYFGKEHFRNYIDIDYLKQILIKSKFEILLIEEGKGFAKYKEEDPICIRLICKKL